MFQLARPTAVTAETMAAMEYQSRLAQTGPCPQWALRGVLALTMCRRISAERKLLSDADEVAVEVEERKLAHSPGFVGGAVQPGDAGRGQAQGGPLRIERVDVRGAQVGAVVAFGWVEVCATEEVHLCPLALHQKVVGVDVDRAEAQPPPEGLGRRDVAGGQDGGKLLKHQA